MAIRTTGHARPVPGRRGQTETDQGPIGMTPVNTSAIAQSRSRSVLHDGRYHTLWAAKSRRSSPVNYFSPTIIENSPTRGARRRSRKPASRIQSKQSAAVKSKPPAVMMSMLRLASSADALVSRSSSINRS